jgi:ATP-binding cassette subfamily F protein 3
MNKSSQGASGKTKEQKRAEAEARNARSKARKELEQKVTSIEQSLAALEKRKLELVELLQDGATYADAVKFRALSEELEQIEPKIAQETAAWEQATEAFEAMVMSEKAS